MLKAFKRVFKEPWYLFLAVITSSIVFLFSVYFSNLGLIRKVVFSMHASFAEKLDLLTELLLGIYAANRPLAVFTIIGVSVLFGINLSMLVYMLKRNRQMGAVRQKGRGALSAIGGLFGGILGLGCAACGSLILTPILAFFGAVGILALLPLGGSEFGLVAMLLLGISIFLLSKKINDPLICPVE